MKYKFWNFCHDYENNFDQKMCHIVLIISVLVQIIHVIWRTAKLFLLWKRVQTKKVHAIMTI